MWTCCFNKEIYYIYVPTLQCYVSQKYYNYTLEPHYNTDLWFHAKSV